MNLQEQFDNYVKATEISVGKILGREPLKFKEYVFTEDGIKREFNHEALPVTIENQEKLYALLDELEVAQGEIEGVLADKQSEFLGLSQTISPDDEAEEDKEAKIKKDKEIIEKLTKLTKEIKKIGRDLEKKVMDIRLDIAVLLFSRASQGMTKERVKKFLDKEQLSIMEHIAKGLTIPPPQLPEKNLKV